jgi:hypothetical protein
MDLFLCRNELLLEVEARRLGRGWVEVVEDLLRFAVEALARAVAFLGLLGNSTVGGEEDGAGTAEAAENG